MPEKFADQGIFSPSHVETAAARVVSSFADHRRSWLFYLDAPFWDQIALVEDHDPLARRNSTRAG